MRNKYYEGFEKERKFHIILEQALCDCTVLKARTVKRIIAHVAPQFLEGLFESRPCIRKLKYIGCGCEEPVCPMVTTSLKSGRHIGQQNSMVGHTRLKSMAAAQRGLALHILNGLIDKFVLSIYKEGHCR